MKKDSAVKTRIEKCALRLFVEKGVSATTIKDIANAADVAEGALYRHYKSKDELAKKLFQNGYETCATEIFDYLRTEPDLKKQLQIVAHYFCDEFDEDPILFQYLLLSQYDHFDLSPKDRPIYLKLLDLFKQAIHLKKVNIKDNAFGASLFTGIIFQAALDRISFRINRTMKEDRKDLFEAILDAIRWAN